MTIPAFLDRDDYLQNPVMRRFLKKHKIELANSRADYIKAIETYAAQSDSSKAETELFLLTVAKEGSKEICFRKIYRFEEWHEDPVLVDAKIQEAFPNCPRKNILSYCNTGDQTLIDYHISTDEHGRVTKIDFTFSSLFLYGAVGEFGDVTVFPVFIEVYIESGFIVSRAKAKSTLFKYDEENHFLDNASKINTTDYAVQIIDEIVNVFGFEVITKSKITKNEIDKMLYSLYEKYSFTPKDVVEQVESQNVVTTSFVNAIFNNLNLDVRNKEAALMDSKILVEKFISINGDNEDIFKKDRPAYLIKVSTDNDTELTKIDTASYKLVPLQCTEAFFDSKKAVVKSKQCKRLILVFKRADEMYFGRSNPLMVQLGAQKDHGYIKTLQYAEEADIQNVLQAVFENY